MEHLLDQPRGPIDPFERLLINVFSEFKTVQAIWVREARVKERCKKLHPHQPTEECSGAAYNKRFLRAVWLQLTHRSLSEITTIRARTAELQTRVTNEPFLVEVKWVVDELPPASVAPSCIFRRGSGKV